MSESKFENWAVVELFGHAKIAGLCSERNVAGVNMLQVDVPETDTSPSFTRLIGGSAIYAINPCTEEIVRSLAGRLQVKPIESWDISKWAEKNQKMLAPASQDGFDFNEDN